MQALWLLLVVTQHFTFVRQYLRDNIPVYRPFKGIKWLFYRVLTRGAWKFYKNIFIWSIRFCFKRRHRSYLWLGEWLIIIIFLLWALWPLLTPILDAVRKGQVISPYATVPVSVVCMFLLRTGKVRLHACNHFRDSLKLNRVCAGALAKALEEGQTTTGGEAFAPLCRISGFWRPLANARHQAS